MGNSIKEKSSPYKGVTFARGKWISKVKVADKTIILGRYIDVKEAAKAYDLYVIRHNLNRTTNFLKKKQVIN